MASCISPGKAKAPCCRVPSGFTSFGPHNPQRGCVSIKATSAASAPGCATVSGLSSQTCSASPGSARSARLLPLTKPMLSAQAMSVASGNSARTMAAESSDEAESTTITRCGTPCARSDVRQPRSKSRTFQETMMTSTMRDPRQGLTSVTKIGDTRLLTKVISTCSWISETHMRNGLRTGMRVSCTQPRTTTCLPGAR